MLCRAYTDEKMTVRFIRVTINNMKTITWIDSSFCLAPNLFDLCLRYTVRYLNVVIKIRDTL